MNQIRCEFCHKYVDSAVYNSHRKQHLKLRTDGQQTDYATLPPEDREAGEINEVPRVYLHNRCRTLTEMPEDIIRSYLKNPYLYMSDQTFCTGCVDHVPFKECTWVETGENLQTYMDDLRAKKPELGPNFITKLLIKLFKYFM